MLYLDSPIRPVNGLVCFRDHADPDMYYYAVERPRLARNDGVPEFVFLVYRRDITDNPNLTPQDKQQLGGGFLAFTVDLSVDDATLDAARRRLASISGGTVKFAPVQYRKGTVRLSITKDVAEAPNAAPDTQKGVAFFEQEYGATKPSLIGDNRATFGVILDHEGALLMQAALKSGVSPIGVIYDLEFLGMRPAFNVKIHADYKRIYNHLETQIGVKGGYGPISAAVDIGMAWQKLRDEGAIKVEVTNFTDDENFRKQADSAFDWFKTELLRDFFKSSLEPPSFMRQGQSAGLLGSLQSLLGPLIEPQQGSPTPQRGQPTTQAPTVAPPPASMESGQQTTADRNQAATQTAPAAGAGGGATGGGATFGLQVGFSLKMYQQEELKERDFEYSMQAAVAQQAAPQGLFSTMVDGLDLSRAIKEVDLDDDFFKRINAKFTLAADLAAEKIASVTVNAEYPGVRPEGTPPAQVVGFTFTPQDTTPKTFQTFVNKQLDLRYRYKIGVDFGSDSDWEGNEPHFESDWIVTTDPAPNINPFEALDRLDVEVAVGSDVQAPYISQVQVELEFDDPLIGMHAERTMVFKPGEPSKHWKLRFGETKVKTFRYRRIFFLENNVRYQTDWTVSDEITTESVGLVINSPFQGQLPVRLVPLLDPASIVEANVDMVYQESDTGYERRDVITLQGGTAGPLASQSLKIPTIARQPVKLSYTVTIVRVDGSVFVSEPTDMPAAQSVIVVSDGSGVTHRISVELAGADFAAAGLVAARVRLRGPGEDPDVAETMFRPGAPGAHALSLVQPGTGEFRYHYEVEGYTTQGLPRPGVSGESTDRALVLPMPAA